MTKKFVAAILTVVMLVSMLSAFSVISSASSNIWVYQVDKTTTTSSQRQRIAISKKKTYTITYAGTSANATYKDDGARLTDGNVGTGTSYQSVFDGNGTTSIVVDLGSEVVGLTDMYVRFLNDATYGFALPASVKFYVSTDGGAYSYAGEGSVPTSVAEDTGYSIGFTKERGCAARYLKAEIVSSGKVAVSEFSGYIWADVMEISASGAEDSQGVVYTTNSSAGTAYVTSYTNSYFKTETIQGPGITPCSATGLVNNTTWTIGKGSEMQATVTADFVPAGRGNRPGTINNNKKYVVIHNTGNFDPTSTAYNNHKYLRNSSPETGWQYTVGKDGIYQGIPDNELAWHASDGSWGNGNYYGIGMEICVNGWTSFSGSAWTNFLNNTFYYNCRAAAMLTAELCVRWNLNPGDCSAGTAIRQHWDSNSKNCPQQMRYNTSTGTYTRDTGDLWVYFKGKVQEYYKMLKGGGTVTKEVEYANTTVNVEIPQYVYDKSAGVYCKVTGVASKAFNSKSNLVSVYLPNTISWGSADTAYASSANLVNINVSPTNEFIYSKGGKLYLKADNTLLASPAKNSGNGVAKADPAVYSIPNFTLDTPYENDYNANIDKNRFTGLNKGVSASALKGMFVDKISVYTAAGAEMADTAVAGTGCYMKSEDGDDTCVIVVRGDLDGDGNVSATDYIQMRSHLKGNSELEGVYLEAGAFSSEGNISAADCITMKLLVATGN